MSNDSTRVRRLEEGRDALALMHEYAVQFPELPLPAITLYSSANGQPLLQVQTDLPGFEAWRDVLGIDTDRAQVYSVGPYNSHISVGDIVRMGVGDRVVEVFVSVFSSGLPGVEERPAQAPQRQQEDPHNSDLHHDYAVPHDLPASEHTPEILR